MTSLRSKLVEVSGDGITLPLSKCPSEQGNSYEKAQEDARCEDNPHVLEKNLVMKEFSIIFCLVNAQLFAQVNDSTSFFRAYLLKDESIMILDIENNSDSILIFNSRLPSCRIKDSTYFIDMGLTNLNGTPTFLEPETISTTYFIRVHPKQLRKFAFVLNNIDGDSSVPKEWAIDFHFFYLPVYKVLHDGYINYEFLNMLCEEKIGIHRWQAVFIAENPVDLCIRNLKFLSSDLKFYNFTECKNK